MVDKTEVKKGYDHSASSYDASISKYPEFRRVEEISRVLSPERRMHVLEIGVGTGAHLSRTLHKTQAAIGLDLSRQMLKKAKTRTKGKALLIEGDAERLPFADNSFDLVMSFEVLQYLEDYDAFFDEVDRVLKPKGRFICTSWNRYFAFLQAIRRNPLVRLFKKVGPMDVKRANYVSGAFVRRKLRQRGFHHIIHRGVTYFPIMPKAFFGIARCIDRLLGSTIMAHLAVNFLITATK